MNIKGYLFDYGGTLDTGGCHWGKLMWKAYQQTAIPVSETQFREAYVYAERALGRISYINPSFTFFQTLETKINLQFQYLASVISNSADATSIVRMLYSYAQENTACSRTVLEKIPEPKVLVTNFYGNMSTVLHEFELSHLFSSVVESALVGVRKPDPRIFSIGVEMLNLQPSEVAIVGDSLEKDILPAHTAGLRTIWLRGEQWTEQMNSSIVADRIIENLSELLDDAE